MIKRLHIENYLLIDNLDVEFADGLNIITGETGAGKSILLGAISLLLGAKADSKSSRNSDKKSIVEAIFNIEKFKLQELFAENDVEYDDETTISRVTLPSGKSRAFINDLPVSLATLKIIGEHLIDIHSQHQTLLLSQENFQLGLLDSVAKTQKLCHEYSICYSELKRSHLRLAKLREESARNISNYDYIKYLHEELESSDIKTGELEAAESEFALLANVSQVKDVFFALNDILDGEDNSIISLLKGSSSSLSRITDVSPLAASVEERISSILYELKDINSDVYSYVDSLTDNPERKDELEERINKINKLLIKHNVKDENKLIEIREDLEAKLLNIDLSSVYIENCEKAIAQLTEQATSLAASITEKRASITSKIEDYVVKQLHNLGMESAQFKVGMEQSEELAATGRDRIKFLFSANKGSELMPIERVASGGEMSRVMLSLKSLSATYKNLPTIIFDEIDTGVSGKVADKMGEIMSKLSSSLQTICITHLPQVASKGESHFIVEKKEVGETTITSISRVVDSDRVEVIAKMLSGSKVTDAAREQAQLLLK